MKRRTFLHSALASGASALLDHDALALPVGGRAALDGRRPNFVILMTDQQRAAAHWPKGLSARLQPSLDRLAATGLTFQRAFTSAAQCTPSRGAIMTGTYPWANGVTNTYDGAPLQSFQMNLGRLLREAGYDVAYKGKWHLSPAAAGDDRWTARDIEAMRLRYDLPEWNPPDAGTSLTAPATAGGGKPDNDGRFVRGVAAGAKGQTQGFGQSILDWLERRPAAAAPFCLFASLVNPHDIGLYPRYHEAAGYTAADFADLGVDLPANFADSLDTKPGVQAAFRRLFDQAAPIGSDRARREYVNFYAHLHRVVEPHLAQVLDALDTLRLTETTIIIRLADHGEQALSHGLIEKMYSAYEETIRVPVIVSNPLLFPRAASTEAFWSHVDLLPTVAALAGIPAQRIAALGVAGLDQSPVLAHPQASVRDSILFTYDDRYGSATAGVVVNGHAAPAMPADQPPHIRTLRDGSWKYCVYFTRDGSALQYELYNLDDDPGEMRNLAFEPTTGNRTAQQERARLHADLSRRLVATRTLPLGFRWPARSGAARADSA